MSKLDKMIQLWLANANTTISHPSDMDRLNRIVKHGYSRVPNFSSANLRERINQHAHNFSDESLDDLMDKVEILLSFCRSNFPKSPSKEQIEYNRINDPVNGMAKRRPRS